MRRNVLFNGSLRDEPPHFFIETLDENSHYFGFQDRQAWRKNGEQYRITFLSKTLDSNSSLTRAISCTTGERSFIKAMSYANCPTPVEILFKDASEVRACQEATVPPPVIQALLALPTGPGRFVSEAGEWMTQQPNGRWAYCEATSLQELEFLRHITTSPLDSFYRFRYAEWLEANDQPAKANLMAMTAYVCEYLAEITDMSSSLPRDWVKDVEPLRRAIEVIRFQGVELPSGELHSPACIDVHIHENHRNTVEGEVIDQRGLFYCDVPDQVLPTKSMYGGDLRGSFLLKSIYKPMQELRAGWPVAVVVKPVPRIYHPDNAGEPEAE